MSEEPIQGIKERTISSKQKKIYKCPECGSEVYTTEPISDGRVMWSCKNPNCLSHEGCEKDLIIVQGDWVRSILKANEEKDIE